MGYIVTMHALCLLYLELVMLHILKTHGHMHLVHKTLITTLACTLVLAGCASKPRAPSNARPTIVNYNGIPSHYQVRSGDTVSKIAARYGLNWREVSALNRLDSKHTIHVGQWLTLHNHTNTRTQNNTRANTFAIQTPTSNTRNTQTQARATAPSQTQQSAPSLPTASITARPVSINSALLSFSYPVARTNPVARRFGTPTAVGMTEGIFFSGKEGDIIMAAGSGTIIHADTNIATKDRPMIMIQHDNGYVSSYFDVKNIQVRSGQTVGMGQTLGNMITQTDSGIALFEFRIAKNGSYIDPVSVLH